MGGGGGLLCLFVLLSDFVWTISPEPFNCFNQKLTWWCVIMRRSVMNKSWVTTFNVKVTARAYIAKIWLFLVLFLLYLLNFWPIINQTWFGGTTSESKVYCGKNGLLRSVTITVFDNQIKENKVGMH